MKKQNKRKKQSNINELLYFLIFFALLGILYMLFENEIKSLFIKEPPQKEEIKVEAVQKEELLPSLYDDSWFLNDVQDYQRYKITANYIVDIKEPLNTVVITIPLPQNQKNWQYMWNLNTIPQPERIYTQNDNRYVEYILKNAEPNQYKFTINSDVSIRKYDINTAKNKNLNLRPEININRYLISEENINLDSEYLKRAANNITGSTQEEIVRKIYSYIQNNIKYTTNTRTIDAEQVLKEKKAFCSGFASLMVALCRIKGIPARIVAGNLVTNDNDSKHNWVEVYYSEYGWVMYDPTFFVVNKNGETKSQEENIRTPKYNYFLLHYNTTKNWDIQIQTDKEIQNPASLIETFEYIKI